MSNKIIPRGGNDEVMTPSKLANEIVEYFDPFKREDFYNRVSVLEPCYGRGAFVNALMENAKKNDSTWGSSACSTRL
jgi:hypothetical protein